MSRQSLRLRLGLVGGLSILGALALSVIGLTLLFERHVQRVAVADLEARSYSVAAMIEMTAPHRAGFRPAPVDPLYEQPFSGHYWQLELGPDTRRSRSLWDVTLPRIGLPLPPGTARVLDMTGPEARPLLAFETWLSVDDGASTVPVRIVVATDRAALDEARSGFLRDLLPYSAALGLLLVLAFWAQLTVGMRPLTAVSDRVAALRSGRIARMGTSLPAEVLPLAGEIDTLLSDRDGELLRARNRAADLAHGLKTPLQALLGDAAHLRERGDRDLADSIETIATGMRGLVERELRRATIQSDRRPLRANLLTIVSGVVNVLRRTPDGAALSWEVDIAADLELRIDPDDLAEAFGALAENAARHATGRVAVQARAEAGMATIRLSDDGPGAPADAMRDLVRRGFRADERAGGQGLGLAIAGEIVEAAGGALSFSNDGPGLEVLLKLPTP
ncbi:HAMP domain-containing histidine kinase [Cereibacter sphaeroides]|uniref:sensor histidine kinase n=1 Tax=Cereibacter sphaeroides TaxID=1063 RepID=UPI001F3EF9D5|nr:HAMP domain-containing sensor histidine kinase [Cereibacter sphaeroides]MCE6957803.1 HAMP domain-containing histidine kinase [Cereibacter sphaeroides]MCE6969854.1 HAMP domain-containing histidine kinase [Cereibacter sphaeroides]MCE6971697.1 HAMP domain-containing histidine kinase [Cereibacter sphaeroides]